MPRGGVVGVITKLSSKQSDSIGGAGHSAGYCYINSTNTGEHTIGKLAVDLGIGSKVCVGPWDPIFQLDTVPRHHTLCWYPDGLQELLG